jgi:hypothetical protein
MKEAMGEGSKPCFILVRSFEFIHSCNRCLGLRNKPCLTARGIEIGVFDVGQVEGSDAGRVDKKGC